MAKILLLPGPNLNMLGQREPEHYGRTGLDAIDARLAELAAAHGHVLERFQSNAEHELVKVGKAGRKRWMGRKPHNRGVSMNPIDHPHGGGEGRTSGGRHPVSPWGVPTKGHRTRKNKRTDNMIVRRRGSK